MKEHEHPVQINDDIILGGGQLVLFAGPCSIETEKITFDVAENLNQLRENLPVQVVFKSSFDKANRTSIDSYRSVGISKGLEILKKVRDDFGFPLITDIHETSQISEVAEVVDVLQIPAFLSRQTDLLFEAGKSGRAVNIKKGQFMSSKDMSFALAKVNSQGKNIGFLTERGTTFGYGDLVVDFRSLPIMREFSPVVHDVTHSIQQPGALGGKSGGQSWLAGPLARAAVAVGVDGLFIETHPNPEDALSDGPNMIPSKSLEPFLENLLAIREASQY